MPLSQAPLTSGVFSGSNSPGLTWKSFLGPAATTPTAIKLASTAPRKIFNRISLPLSPEIEALTRFGAATKCLPQHHLPSWRDAVRPQWRRLVDFKPVLSDLPIV